MKRILQALGFGLLICILSVGYYPADAAAIQSINVRATPVRAKTQAAVQRGTEVSVRTEVTGLYSQECYDAYYGCMDLFCNPDNVDGGSCACSNENAKYEKELEEIKKILVDADRIGGIEVEKINMGSQADIVFNQARKYDASGNVLSVDAPQKNDKAERRQSLLALWDTKIDDDIWGDDTVDMIANKTGDALRRAADTMCREQMPESCTANIAFLSQMYSRKIVSDCKGFENTVTLARTKANDELAKSRSDVRLALKKSFDTANKYDRGTCMVKYKECMLKPDACGTDWKNCVSTIAFENMQNQKAVSTARTKVPTIIAYNITDSTMEILNAKRNICENILDECMLVRDHVWPDFLREAAPEIKLAELNAESNMRQSCLTDISDCIQNSCKDDIAGKGVATMDACLSRPEMARSFCKIQIDRCERMEPLIWGYVTDKLAAMRVDACTKEVKDCFEERCGSDFSGCIGMDYEYMHALCPITKLVVCRANDPKFSMTDLDSMLMGLYLNIDNSLIELCQNKIDTKMREVCGNTTNCDIFATNDTIGTGSLHAQKDKDLYRITGMISFGSIKMGDAYGNIIDSGDDTTVRLKPGEIGVQEYISQIKTRHAGAPNAFAIIPSIEEELNSIAGVINDAIKQIEGDKDIQFCINGRDLSNVKGVAGQKTTGRFPNMLNSVKMQIATSGLRQAQENYNKKWNAETANATKNASIDVAQYMCQKIAEGGASTLGNIAVSTPLTAPYAISFDIGTGLSVADLTRGGAGVVAAGGIKVSKTGGDGKNSGSGVVKETTALFSRETRTCHICTTTMTQSCKTEKKGGFWGIGKKTSEDCETAASEPMCEDIVM